MRNLVVSGVFFIVCLVAALMIKEADAQTVSVVPSSKTADQRALDAAVRSAIAQGDLTRAKTLAVTSAHWEWIQAASTPDPKGPRTYGDMRVQMASSQACKDAQRSYQLEANSARSDHSAIYAAKNNMRVACGY